MASAVGLPVEERILPVLRHLGIDQARFAGRMHQDRTGLASTYPEAVASLTLIGPSPVDSHTAGHLASKLLMFSGNRGPTAERACAAIARVPEARLVALCDYSILAWTDVAADRTDEPVMFGNLYRQCHPIHKSRNAGLRLVVRMHA